MMKTWMVLFLPVLITLWDNTSALTGHVCYTAVTKSQTFTEYRQVSKASSYRRGCGWWRKCTYYRHRYHQESQIGVRKIYVYQQRCCAGWRVDKSGKCAIHDRAPEVTFCPTPMTIQAVSEPQQVSWELPRFREPYGYRLQIISGYEHSNASLPWGQTTIRYIAKSLNNQKTSSCEFTIDVIPPLDHAVIVGYIDAKNVTVQAGVSLTLECRADHGFPPFQLEWYLGVRKVTSGTAYKVEPHGYENLLNAVATFTFTPSEYHNGMAVECRASKAGRSTERVMRNLVVKYDPKPVVDSCPNDMEVTVKSRAPEITRPDPVFSDIKNHTLDVSCNYKKEQAYDHGKHTVKCIAKNTLTGTETNCSYTISVLAAMCDFPIPPVGGAIACGFYEKHQVEVCQYMCQSNKDIPIDVKLPELLVCSLDGVWFPRVQTFECSESRGMTTYMPSGNHYLPKNCRAAGITYDAKLLFITVLRQSMFYELCEVNDCEPDEFTMNCG